MKIFNESLPSGEHCYLINRKDTKCLIIKNKWTSDLLKIVKENAVSELNLGSWSGSMTFLEDLEAPIKCLIVDLSQSSQGESISKLVNLETLRISGPIGEIDFTKLIKLKELSVGAEGGEPFCGNWAECPWLQNVTVDALIPNLTPLANLKNLQKLACGNKALESLEGLNVFTKLERFVVGDTNWKSLDGIEVLKNLKSLRLYFMPNVTDIEPISKFTNLRELELVNLIRLRDLTPLAKCTKLQQLSLDGCREFESFKPLAALKSLELLSYDTETKGNILDGDLSPLLGLKKLKVLCMVNKRHYKPSTYEVRKMNGMETSPTEGVDMSA